MKFAEHLSAHITPEWRKQYISYEEMKAMLYTAVEEAPSVESVEPEVLTRHFASFDEVFFTFCDRELKKINTFYSEKLAEATRKYAALQSELKTAQDMQHGGGKNKGKTAFKAHLPTRKIRELKLAFSEFYLSLILLQNYQNLNYTGFRKILKKHDKLLSVDTGSKWKIECVEIAHFYTSKDIDKLIQDTEATVTSGLEGGDRQRAMKRLRVPPLGEHQSPWTTFKVGLFSGSFIVLFVAVVLSDKYENTWESPWLWLWLVSSFINSIYSYTWDIKMDWGLLDGSAGENKFLREEVVYSSASFYYFAIIEDFVLRFVWIMSFVLIEYEIIGHDLMTSIVAPLEVFRRFVWNFFRLENEHLNNCGKFRAVRDISIAPLESSDQIQILRMMDEDNGVLNRGKRKGGGKKQSGTKEEKRMLLKDETIDMDVSNTS